MKQNIMLLMRNIVIYFMLSLSFHAEAKSLLPLDKQIAFKGKIELALRSGKGRQLLNLYNWKTTPDAIVDLYKERFNKIFSGEMDEFSFSVIFFDDIETDWKSQGLKFRRGVILNKTIYRANLVPIGYVSIAFPKNRKLLSFATPWTEYIGINERGEIVFIGVETIPHSR